MKAPNFSVHNFACPDCELNCQLIQDGPRASMRHQWPACKTYNATKKDGQKFLELAYIAIPIDKPDPVMVAFRESGKDATAEPGDTLGADTVTLDDLADAAPKVSEPSAEFAAALADAQPRVTHEPVTTGMPESWPSPERSRPTPNPPRWQPLLELLSSELRGQIYDRRQHSLVLAQAMVEAKPGDMLTGFDDTRIAALAQSIVALCAASKGHP